MRRWNLPFWPSGLRSDRSKTTQKRKPPGWPENLPRYVGLLDLQSVPAIKLPLLHFQARIALAASNARLEATESRLAEEQNRCKEIQASFNAIGEARRKEREEFVERASSFIPPCELVESALAICTERFAAWVGVGTGAPMRRQRVVSIHITFHYSGSTCSQGTGGSRGHSSALGGHRIISQVSSRATGADPGTGDGAAGQGGG